MDLNDWFISLDGNYEDGAPIQKRYSLAQLTGGVDASARQADEASVKKDGKEVVAALHGVVMGRRSGPPSLDPKSGSFACTVTSRHHAQLNITSNGHVYITDLGSLHRTHIVPPASLSTYLVKDANDQSKSQDYPSEIALSPWTPVQLCHLDTIVLGKMVVNERSQHKPIKLKVTFRYPELGEARPGGRKRLSRKTREQAETTFAHETGLLAIKNAIMAISTKSQSQSQMREGWAGQPIHQSEVSTASAERTRVIHPAGEATLTQSLKFKLETIVKSEMTQSQQVIEADKLHDSVKPMTSASQPVAPRYNGPSRGVDFEWLANLRSDKVIMASSSDDSIGSENVPVAADLSDSPRQSRAYGVPLSVLYSSEDDDDLPRGTQPAAQSEKSGVADNNADEDDGMLEIEKVSSRHIVTIVPSSDDAHSDDDVHIIPGASSPFSTYSPGPRRPVPAADRPVPAVETSRADDTARPKSRSRTMEDDASNRGSPVSRAQRLNAALSKASQAYKDRSRERADEIRLAQGDRMNHINTTADDAGDDEALPGMGTWYSFSDNEDDEFHPRSPRLAAATRVVSIVEPAPTRHHNPVNVLDKLMDMVEEADDVMSQGEAPTSSVIDDEGDQPGAEMDDGLDYHIEVTGDNDKLDLVECSSEQDSDFAGPQEPPEEYMAESDASMGEGYDSARDYEERSDYGDERSSMSGEGDSHYGDYDEDASISGSHDADAQDEDDQDRKDDEEYMDDEIDGDDENEEEDEGKGEVDGDEDEEDEEDEESTRIDEIGEIGVEDLGTAGDVTIGPTSVVLVEEVHELVVEEEDGAEESAEESVKESAGEGAEEDMHVAPEEHAVQASEDEGEHAHAHAHEDTSSRVREPFTPVEQILVGTHLDHPLIQSLSSAGIRVPVSQLGELLEVEAEGQEMALEDILQHKEEADLAKAIEESTRDDHGPAAPTLNLQSQPASKPVSQRAPQPVRQSVPQHASQPAPRPAPSMAPRLRPASPSPLAELFRNPPIVNTEGEGPRPPTPRSHSGLLRGRRPDQGVQVDSALPPTLDALIQTDHPMPELTRARTPSISDSSTLGPITPPSTLKRTLSSTTEGEGESSKAVSTGRGAANDPVQGETRPTKRLRSIGRTVGLIAVGAVVGSVGTIAGLMQLGS